MYPDSSYLVVSADMPRRFGSPVGMFSDAQRFGVYMMVQGIEDPRTAFTLEPQ